MLEKLKKLLDEKPVESWLVAFAGGGGFTAVATIVGGADPKAVNRAYPWLEATVGVMIILSAVTLAVSKLATSASRGRRWAYVSYSLLGSGLIVYACGSAFAASPGPSISSINVSSLADGQATVTVS